MACIHATHLVAINGALVRLERGVAKDEGQRAPSLSSRVVRPAAAALPSRTTGVPRAGFTQTRVPSAPRDRRSVIRCANNTAPSLLEQEWVLKGERWHVRLAQQEELKRVSTIQVGGKSQQNTFFVTAESFHESNPIEVLNKMFLGFFQCGLMLCRNAARLAEVYGALLNKAKYTAENRYEDGPFSSPVLVVADLSGRVITGGGHTSIRSAEFACLTAQAPEENSPIVGVAEVSIQGDSQVNQLLDVDEYCTYNATWAPIHVAHIVDVRESGS
eukprot:175979-Prorocentrum_minimum.AAC.1